MLDSLDVIFNSADQSSVVDIDVIQRRHDSVTQQLKANQMHAINVQGDGNCFYCSLSLCLHGHQDNHGNLRKSVANYIRLLSETAAADKRVALIQRADVAAKDGVWVTEDIILAAAEYLHRNINIYISAKQFSPLIYSP